MALRLVSILSLPFSFSHSLQRGTILLAKLYYYIRILLYLVVTAQAKERNLVRHVDKIVLNQFTAVSHLKHRFSNALNNKIIKVWVGNVIGQAHLRLLTAVFDD